MIYNLTPFQALEAAVAAAGSQSALGEICGVSQTAVWKWIQSAKRMPAEYVLRAEAKTGVSKHDLRPDIYPRDTMIDQTVEDRFCGIDLRSGTGDGWHVQHGDRPGDFSIMPDSRRRVA